MRSQISNLKSQILVAGAGPAGAGAAIRLAAGGFAVTLVERETFPRHKLCGEFISPECFAHFRELGVFDAMMAAGGEPLAETVFYAPNGRSVVVPSEWFGGGGAAALGLSRSEMDHRLLARARAVGVEVLEGTQVTGLLIENGNVRGLRAKNAAGETLEIAAGLTIDATGRARVLGKLAEKEFQRRDAERRGEKGRRGDREIGRKSEIRNPKSEIRNRLVGFKAHLRNAEIEKGRCEIYFFPGGYGGVSPVEGGLANHCFLVRADVVKEFSSDAQQIVEKIIFRNRRARQTLTNAEPAHAWLAVAVDGFGLKDLAPAPGLFAVGDAGAFIDPFTGSGMLMALESGEILARCVAAGWGNAAPEKIAEDYRLLHRRKFRRRLGVCSLLRRAAFAPHLAGLIVSALSFGGSLPRRLLAQATRPRFSTPRGSPARGKII